MSLNYRVFLGGLTVYNFIVSGIKIIESSYVYVLNKYIWFVFAFVLCVHLRWSPNSTQHRGGSCDIQTCLR